jgi:hypothetical protein
LAIDDGDDGDEHPSRCRLGVSRRFRVTVVGLAARAATSLGASDDIERLARALGATSSSP